jgi:hypothetical protein
MTKENVVNIFTQEEYEKPPQQEILMEELIGVIKENKADLDVANTLLVIDQVRDWLFAATFIEVEHED